LTYKNLKFDTVIDGFMAKAGDVEGDSAFGD
jgi:cyclophilin family peptidyl-prolyl cis-trans isomerase